MSQFRAVGSFFMVVVEGLSKKVGQKLQKFVISFSENIFSGVQLQFTRSSGYHQSFFIPEFVAENLKVNKNQRKRSLILQYSFAQNNHNNFTNLNSFEIENKMLSNHSQKIFSVYKFFLQTWFCLMSEKTFALHPFLTPKNYFLEAL